MRIFIALVLFLIASALESAPLVRVVAVDDDGRIHTSDPAHPVGSLAGVDLVPDALARTVASLRLTLVGSWVALETDPSDASRWYLFRSPSALFVNEELVRRGLAAASPAWSSYLPVLLRAERQSRGDAAAVAEEPAHEMRLLGESDPGHLPRTAAPRRAAAPKKKTPPPKPARRRARSAKSHA